MLTVVGGAYREVCLHPQWNALFGSGVRAAAAVAQAANTGGVKLHTWVSERRTDEIRGIAASYGFDVQVHRREQEIEFQYDHGLGSPRLYPDPRELRVVSQETITGDHVLCFSLGVGEFRGLAQRLVFDPQAGHRARSPRVSGHTAGTLGIVANLGEVQAMLTPSAVASSSGDHLPTRLGKALLQQEQCAVVVVKNGAEGATVITSSGVTVVPSFRTDQVFPIGSGDVFSGVFAFSWLEGGLSPEEAARLASAATATYCESRVLPIPINLPEIAKKLHPLPPLATPPKRHRVYLAGPLFTLPQLWLLNETKRALGAQGLEVFSPKDEVGFLTDPSHALRVAQADLRGLDGADLVFAILDGLDSGTVFEVGYARAKNKPVIGFAERADPGALTMLLGTGCRVYDDFPTAVYQAAWTARNL